jgi:hypothetical protein
MQGRFSDAIGKNGDRTAGQSAMIRKRRHQSFDAAQIGVKTLGNEQTFRLHAIDLTMVSIWHGARPQWS